MIFGKKQAEISFPIKKSPSELSPITTKKGLPRFSEVERGLVGDKFGLYVLIISIIAILVQFISIAVNWSKFPPEVPLFYSQPWGEKILTHPIYILILPLTVLAFMSLNYFLILRVKEEVFLRRTITAFTILIAFFCTYSLFKLIFLLI